MSNNLINYRQKIDLIDEQILILLKDRIELMEKIGDIKKQKNLSIRDDKREKEKLEIIQQKAKKLNLPLQLINDIWIKIFTQSEKIEK